MTRLLRFSVFLLLAATSAVSAQGLVPRVLPVSVEDALRIGSTEPIGTARFIGTGGSMTSIGVDPTVLHTNPAGIGWNRFSAVSVSPGFGLVNIESTLRNGGNNPTIAENNGTFLLPQVGLVYATETNSINWSTFNFGINLTRVADFNETFSYQGRSEGGIIDGVVENVNDGPNFIDPFRDELAQRIPDVIQEDEFGFFSDFDLDSSLGGQISRNGLVERTGGINELAIGFGGSYRDNLLWGASIGIPFLNFTENRTYQEIDDQDEITFFDDGGFNETLEQSGSGVNLKLGVIGRIGEQFRVSAAVHTPTFWTIDEEYSTEFTYNFTDQGEALGGTEPSELGIRTFNLRTPWRVLAGAGALIGRTGFVSIDANYNDFRGTSFASDDFLNVNEAANDDVDSTLTSSIGLRLGGEINLKPVQLRAGVSYRQLPLRDARNDEDTSFIGLSVGAGYAVGKFFVDLAARRETIANYFAPYRTFAFDGQVVDTERARTMVVLTVGFRGF